jgi:hypothetical protein
MTRAISPLSLFYSLLAGPVLWFVHFVLVWGMAELGCRINFSNMELITPANIQNFVIVSTLIALIAVLVGGFVAYGGWRRLQRTHENLLVGEDRLRFLTMLALLLCGLFLFSIIFTATPVFFLDICDAAA